LSLKRILGIDFGKRRIGIAVSDPLRIIAKGVTVLSNTPDVVLRIREIVLEYDVEQVVVGMPYALGGGKGRSAEEVEAFIERLQPVVETEIVRWDESFSSVTAHETLRMMGVRKSARRSKERIDEMAAAIILQGYLDSLTSR
jgi:putative holliday junction resolvase